MATRSRSTRFVLNRNKTGRLWVVRHGETEWNRERRLQGHRDVPLNETGRDQAREVASRLRQRFADGAPPAIYTSDLKRAAQTSLVIGRALGVPPKVARKLRERGFGILEGKTFDELAETHPDEVRAYRRGQKDAIPEAEPYADFCLRTLKACRAIARREERAIVVTHGGLLKVLLRASEGEGKRFMIANTAVYTFDVGPRASGALRRVIAEDEAISSGSMDAV